MILFRKQIDNLKTNHRVCPFSKPTSPIFFWAFRRLGKARKLTLLKGVYVLTDNSFRPFARMSTSVRSEAVSMAQAVSLYTNYPFLEYSNKCSTYGFHAA